MVKLLNYIIGQIIIVESVKFKCISAHSMKAANLIVNGVKYFILGVLLISY